MKPMFLRFAIVATFWLAPTLHGADAPAAGGFVEHFKAATQAHDARDYAEMERQLRAALKLRPAHPAALYDLAAALVLRGERKEALETLELLADMGLAYDPSGDEDFAALRGSDRFDEAVRDLARNRKPAGGADVAFRLLQPTFIPEGLAFDEDTKHFFVSGVHERRIQRVGPDGRETDFVPPGGGGLWAPLGMVADASRRLLWVATAAIPEMKNADPGELGRAAILAYDLDNGRFKRRLAMPEDGAAHVLGDLVLARDGTIYTTDSKGGRLYAVDSTRGTWRALTAPGALASPQGLVLSGDRRFLYVADYTQGLFRYELDGGALTRLEVAPEICVYGIDGLYRRGDNLIAVQNGIRPHRVVRLRLDRGGRRVRSARVLAANLKDFDEPTQGVIVGRRFSFIANSQWNKFGKDYRLPPAERLRRPTVLRLTLEDDEDDDAPRRSRRAAPQQAPGGAPLRVPLPVCPFPPC